MRRTAIALGFLVCFAGIALAATSYFREPAIFFSTVRVDGATTLKGALTAGDAVTDTAYVTGRLTVDGGVTNNGPLLSKAEVTFGDSAADTVYVTGVLTADGGVTVNGTLDVNGAWIAGAQTVTTAIQNPAHFKFVICGDQTTVNNNTVYYGPSLTLTAYNGGTTCDIASVGNVTEATADGPILTAKAFHVQGMICRNAADANADVSYTLRTAAGATVASVTCTIADNGRDCVADVQTTTAIASGATVAVAVASTGDLGANGFVCEVDATY